MAEQAHGLETQRQLLAVVGLADVEPGEFGDAVEPVPDGVAVGKERRRRGGEVAVEIEIGGNGAHQFGLVLLVVPHQGCDGLVVERVELFGLVGKHLEEQLVGAGLLKGDHLTGSAEPFADAERQLRLVNCGAKALRVGLVARQRKGERESGHGRAGRRQQAPGQGMRQFLRALTLIALGTARQQDYQQALVPVDKRTWPVKFEHAPGLLHKAAHQAWIGNDPAVGVRVLQRAHHRHRALREVGTQEAGTAHQRLAADHLAREEFLDQVAAKACLGIRPGVLPHALHQQGVGERLRRRIGTGIVGAPRHQYARHGAVAIQLQDVCALHSALDERAEERRGAMAAGCLDGLVKRILAGIRYAGCAQNVEVFVKQRNRGIQQLGGGLGDARHPTARDERLTEHAAGLALALLAREGLGDGRQHIPPGTVGGNGDDRHCGIARDGNPRDDGHHTSRHRLCDAPRGHQQARLGLWRGGIVEDQDTDRDSVGTALGRD